MKVFIEFTAWLILIGMMLVISTVHADILKVAVIDTGLDLQDPRFFGHLCPNGHADFTKTGLNDTNGHGTHVTGLIKKYAGNGDYCFVIIKYFTGKGEDMDAYLEALREAIAQNPAIVNMSLSGETASVEERNLICDHPNITFIVAAGNEALNLDVKKRYPASYGCNNTIVVGALFLKSSNYGSVVSDWEAGIDILSTLPNGKEGRLTGTSMSCAITTGRLIYAETHKPN